MHSRALVIAAAVAVVAVTAATSAGAYWILDGVSLKDHESWAQLMDVPRIAPDGYGGAIVVAAKGNLSNLKIYGQHVDSHGRVLWSSSGVIINPLCWLTLYPDITASERGRVIVVFTNSLAPCVIAQKLDYDGNLLWGTSGIAVSSSGLKPKVAHDGIGGAYIAWTDSRSGNEDIYAQRLDAQGAAKWTASGIAVCDSANDQRNPQIIPDGFGGCIIAWEDDRGGALYPADVYAQRIDSTGAALWAAGGVAVCTSANDTRNPQLVSDGLGGAIIVYEDTRTLTEANIYAQRIDASGVARWAADGVPVCTATGDQLYPVIASDGSHGAVFSWDDYRNGTGDANIYAARVTLQGAVQWTVDGVAVCGESGNQMSSAITACGAGNSIITWVDNRTDSKDIYSQQLDINGALQWAADGVPICTKERDQDVPMPVSDGCGGAIIAWRDFRAGSQPFAQRIVRSGYWGYPAPYFTTLRDVPGDQGGYVNLAWDASRMDAWPDQLITMYSVWRAIKPAAAMELLQRGALLFSETSNFAPEKRAPIVRIERAAQQTFYWELVCYQDANSYEHYSKVAPTAFDSTSICSEFNYFQICAHTSDSKISWTGAPDSCRSIDNLPPAPPALLAGEQKFEPAGLELTWRANTEPDLGLYAIYRGTSEDFVPAPGNRIAEVPDTLYFDGGWRWSGGYYYKVAATDIHENESAYALLRPSDVTGGDTPAPPLVTYLAQSFPNPFNPMTTIEFGLDKPARISLCIYDVSGKLVRVLAEGFRPAGRYVETWNGKDQESRDVASGVYFSRLSTGSFIQTRKAVLLR